MMKAAAAVLVAVLALGGVAAAADGLLPDQASPVADQATATTGADAAAHGLGKATTADLGGSAEGQGRATAAGPDATGTAQVGLCRAWQASQGADNGSRMDAVAFQALVEAAGGADRIWDHSQPQRGRRRLGRRGVVRGLRHRDRPGLLAWGGLDSRASRVYSLAAASAFTTPSP
jgi:hypothetical protein